MSMAVNGMTTQERQLCEFLRNLPLEKKNRYDESASNALLYNLFWSLAGGEDKYMRLFFPEGHRPAANQRWELREAQGAVDGAEYTEAARGKACGHIFKSGEATYRCKTCSADDTCVLCSRCYDSSDHTDHMVYISISPGNSGCCDCGDPEAWKIPVHCTIHNETEDDARTSRKGKEPEREGLPNELVESIRMTIGRAFDYLCDVISCSPEHLRLPKTVESIKLDERMSRLTSPYYSGEVVEEPTEYALMLWNDEKHTVIEVRDQVARACKVKMSEALQRAHETDDIGRTIVKYGYDIRELLDVARVIEQIKVTVSIRSARDTFREQMCGTIIEWLGDISGCSVGDDNNILRHVVCEEMLKAWRTGSEASNAEIGKNGIDDQELDDRQKERDTMMLRHIGILRLAAVGPANDRADGGDEDDDDDDDDEDEDIDEYEEGEEVDSDEMQTIMDVMLVDTRRAPQDEDVEMTDDASAQESQEATMAGYPPPPPPPPPSAPAGSLHGQRPPTERENTPSDSDMAEPLIPPSVYAKINMDIPKTPGTKVAKVEKVGRPPKYWLETPAAFSDREFVPLHEDLWQRVRLDWMILFDLRMWKKVRVDLRDLYISTVVTIPQFKRVLGLRFAGLYTLLAQLYLIADREPDHSIINISLQMLTTPSITAEIVERGNFLTHLMAILFTFLTARQVAPPFEINPNAVLKFETGSVTNRRMYHFFMDLRYLFSSPHVQEKLRVEDRYMMQFLDLVKLHQGICPNVRAVGEHVEYETDAWISASLVTREINRLCRQFSESFKWKLGEDITSVSRAIRFTANTVIINSLGLERKRFDNSEIKEEVRFKKVGDYEFDTSDTQEHRVVKFVVEDKAISFHHALHYTLSWLIECGKSMSRDELFALLTFTQDELLQKPRLMGTRLLPSDRYGSEDMLMAAFDYPLRVCAWLAQMKASMWVRNGMSLRHQAGTYRGVTQRDVSHHRDIFLLQTAMITCSPDRVLASMVDRYGLEMWMKGIYEQNLDVLDHQQQLDVAEDMVHLLIVLLCDRTSLLPIEDEPNPHTLAMRRDIIHVLCFKPLSFSEICSKLPDKFQEQEECQEILDEMTTFKAPEGLSDVGTFELKEQFLDEIDPYIAHYNKNQREESETAYRNWISKRTGKPVADVVFEPRLRLIASGAFSGLAAFTGTGIFAQIVYYSLLYPLKAQELTPSVPATRVEAFLHVVLHLVLIAIAEDKTAEDEMSEESLQSFVYIALTRNARSNFMNDAPQAKTIVAILELMSTREAFKSCHPKISLVLKRMRQKRPRNFDNAFTRLGASVDRVSTASPAITNPDEEREKKKKAALERQAKVMAQFQQQQKNFLSNQADIDWGEEDLSDEDMEAEIEQHRKYWKYPSGTCILCQEETNDSKPYGTFAMMEESRILRQTDFSDPDFVREAASVPLNLDRSAEAIRPFGLAGENRQLVRKIAADGQEIFHERQTIGKGFPSAMTKPGPVSVGCGHIMHYKCFELYYQSSVRRQGHQIARHHPERLDLNEFVCPLCKAQGNAFLPIIWKGKEESYPGVLNASISYEQWVTSGLPSAVKRLEKTAQPRGEGIFSGSFHKSSFDNYVRENIVPPLASKLSQLDEAWQTSAPSSPTVSENYGGLQILRNPVQRTPGAFPDISAEANTPLPHGAASVDPAMVEFVNIFRRLGDTMKKNNLQSKCSFDTSSDNATGLYGIDTIAQTLGLSISAAEIQQRGIDSEGDSTFIAKVPQQNLTHLRVLSETASSYMAVGGLRRQGHNLTATQFSMIYDQQLNQLFCGHPQLSTGLPDDQPSEVLFAQDTFTFLTEASICLVPVLELDIMHMVRLCYIAEVVKVILAMAHNTPAQKWMQWIGLYAAKGATASPFQAACMFVTKLDVRHRVVSGFVNPSTRGGAETQGFAQECFRTIDDCQEFVKRYALVYLRKTALLLHVRYGVDFSSCFPHNSNELERLTDALRLPSFDEICEAIGSGQPAQTGDLIGDSQTLNDADISPTQHLIWGWIHAQFARQMTDADAKITVSHPAIFELIGLPKNYDTLMEETMKGRCPTTGKDVSDPMLCLFCGAIFCGQAICCLKDEPRRPGEPPAQIGGAQQHMRKCHNPIGLFINIRKCTVYYLHRLSGSWMVAPYIDRYGEVDPGLRHGRQLHLHAKRYDALLRQVWLGHGVPSVISRKLEQDINNGGWETI